MECIFLSLRSLISSLETRRQEAIQILEWEQQYKRYESVCGEVICPDVVQSVQVLLYVEFKCGEVIYPDVVQSVQVLLYVEFKIGKKYKIKQVISNPTQVFFFIMYMIFNFFCAIHICYFSLFNLWKKSLQEHALQCLCHTQPITD